MRSGSTTLLLRKVMNYKTGTKNVVKPFISINTSSQTQNGKLNPVYGRSQSQRQLSRTNSREVLVSGKNKHSESNEIPHSSMSDGNIPQNSANCTSEKINQITVPVKNESKASDIPVLSPSDGSISQNSVNSTSEKKNRTQKKYDRPQPPPSVNSVTQRFKSLNVSKNSRNYTTVKRPQRFVSTSSSTACTSLEDVARHILEKKITSIVIMAGAGISTQSGIPDFRSPGSGLYDNLQQYKIPYPEAIFDLDFFGFNPKPFFTLAKELYPNGRYRPNIVHYFFRLLLEKGILFKIYTQNIDSLERVAGVPPEKMVEAHGTFATATCTRCNLTYRGSDVKAVVDRDEIPRCRVGNCQGIIKPDIVFFGEELPQKFWSYVRDFPQADLLLVMGTSLEVEPFASIVDATRSYIPRVLFNREAVGVFKKKRRVSDIVVKGNIDENINTLAEMLNWKDELDKLMERLEEEAKTKPFSLDPPGVQPRAVGGRTLPTGNNQPRRGLASQSANSSPALVPISRPHRLPSLGVQPRSLPGQYVRRPAPPRRRPDSSSSSDSSTTSSSSSDDSSDS